MLRRASAIVLLTTVTAVVAAGCSGSSCHPTQDGRTVCEQEDNTLALVATVGGLVLFVGAVVLVVLLVARSSRNRKARTERDLHQVLNAPPVLGGGHPQPPDQYGPPPGPPPQGPPPEGHPPQDPMPPYGPPPQEPPR